MQKNFCLCLYFFVFALKAKLQVLKFEFFLDYVEVESQINLQLTGKVSLESDSCSIPT